MNNLASDPTMNFHFRGHGSPNWIGNGLKDNDPALLNIAYWDIKSLLDNLYPPSGPHRSHPYRFVFLDACETANDPNWSKAFGVLPRITSAELAQRPLKVQAFVGWHGSPRAPNSTEELYDYALTYGVLYSAWMNGFTLDDCITFASSQHPLPPPYDSITLNFPLGTRFYGNGFYWALPPWGSHWNTFRIQVMGYAGITRDGYQPGHDNSPYYYNGQ